MYKTRLAKWGLYKKNREHEMKTIFSIKTERAAVGKDSSFELRGRRVDMKDAERYFKRKGFTLRDVTAWKAAHMTTPLELRCFTPEPQEMLITDVRTYYSGSFEAGTWISKGAENPCFSAKKSHTSFTLLEDIRNSLILACILLSGNSSPEAFKELHWVCSKIQEIVIEEDPHSIPRLIEIMILIKAFGRHELVVILLRHLSNMSAVVPSTATCPLSRIFAALCGIESDQFEDTALRAWEAINDVLQETLGPTHLSTFMSKFERLDTASSSLDLKRQEMYLDSVLESGRASCASSSLQSISLLRGLAKYFVARQKYPELHRTATEMVYRSQRLDLGSMERGGLIECGLEFVAEAQFRQCQFAQAAMTFTLLAKLASAELGPVNAKTRGYQASSEECLSKLGQPSPACHTCLGPSTEQYHCSKYQDRTEPSDGIKQTEAATVIGRRFYTRTLP